MRFKGNGSRFLVRILYSLFLSLLLLPLSIPSSLFLLRFSFYPSIFPSLPLIYSFTIFLSRFFFLPLPSSLLAFFLPPAFISLCSSLPLFLPFSLSLYQFLLTFSSSPVHIFLSLPPPLSSALFQQNAKSVNDVISGIHLYKN